MKTHESLLGHPSDELLELYWFRRLADFRLDEMEEHLLVCPVCQDRMEETDSYVQAMKYACRHAVEHTTPPRLSKWSVVPTTVLASLFAVASIAVTLPLWNRSHQITGAETSISLIAARGAGSGVVSGRAGGPLNLTMDLSGLTPLPSYRVQVVRGSGRSVWESAAAPSSGQLSVRIAHRLEPGLYWVRVSGPDAEPLREFGLELK